MAIEWPVDLADMILAGDFSVRDGSPDERILSIQSQYGRRL